MVLARDGVVGYWNDYGVKPKHIPSSPAALDLWGTSERLFTMEAEMLSGISYDHQDKGGDGICVHYQGRRKGDEGGAIAHLIRPTEAIFEEQLAYVRNYAALRLERNPEIMAQLGSSLGFLGMVGFLQPQRMRKTRDVLAVSLNVTRLVQQRVKHVLACRRPIEYSPQVQPMIQTPGHGSLPSGHATEAFVLAFVLHALMTAKRNGGKKGKESDEGKQAASGSDPAFVQLMRHAERIAINRTVAGVHFPADSAAGMVFGQALADYYIKRFGGTRDVHTRTFRGTAFAGDFSYQDVLEQSKEPKAASKAKGKKDEAQTPPRSIYCSAKSLAIMPSPLLQHVWDEAVKEWDVEMLDK